MTIHNQKGFVLIFVCTFLCLIISSALGLAMMSFWFQTNSKLLHICRVQSLTIQKSYIQKMQELFLLNPLAKKLQLEYVEAQVELAVAISSQNTAAIANAKEKLDFILEQKNILAARQLKIILIAKKMAENQIYQMQQELNLTSRLSEFHNSPTALHVIPIQPAWLAPEYKVAEPFASLQKLSIRWKTPTAEFLKSSLHLEKPNTAQSLQGECESSITFEENKWSEKLIQGKY